MSVQAKVRATARSVVTALGLQSVVHRLKPPALPQVVWLVHDDTMWSRVFVANLVGEAGTEKDPLTAVPYELRVYAPSGRLCGRRRGSIGADQMLVLESAALLAEMGVRPPHHGLVEFRFFRETVRTLRPYVHYLTDTSCVLNHGGLHSKLTPPTDTLRERYPTFTKLLLNDESRVQLAVYNADVTTNRARLVAVNADGKKMESAEMVVPAHGAVFSDVEAALPGIRGFLDGRLGSVHLSNPLDPITMTWFIHNTRLGTLQCNHG